MKLGILREGKTPPEARTPLSPGQCVLARESYPVELVVQPSPVRCFTNAEYEKAGLDMREDLSDCDVLLGIKEVPIPMLIPEKTYFFFSHTIKKQSYNRALLQAILKEGIRLIDYEVLTDEKGVRLIAFGRFAGMVGAHNALYAYGRRTGAFSLPRMKDCHDYTEAKAIYRQTQFPPLKVVVTGGGRVGKGACEVLHDMGFHWMPPNDFLHAHPSGPVYTRLNPEQYAARKDGGSFTPKDFYTHPEAFVSAFAPYTQAADIFINGIFYDQKAPAFFSLEAMRDPGFHIQVIADITCDIAPDASVPSTLRASTIGDPVYGFDPFTNSEIPPYQPGGVDVMAIDNLPSEMPRDSSLAFGKKLLDVIFPELLKPDSPVIQRATIAENGRLTTHFAYLQDYVDGKG